MKKLKKFIEKYESISKEDWELISSSFRRKELPLNYNLLEEGKVCKNLYFLESGLLRFFIVKEGIEVNKFFTVDSFFFTSQASFNSKTPSTEYIQTIEKSIVWETSYEENQELLKLPSWSSFGRKITQEVQLDTEKILEEIQTETAESRYVKLLENKPDLLQRISLKHLASYFGIAPQSLSRIRKKIGDN